MSDKNIVREKLALTKDEAIDIAFGDNPDYEVVVDEVVDTTRWSIITSVVVRRKSDGKFFADSYSKGATEQQYESPYENTDPDFTEVFPKEKVTIVYE